MVQHAKAYYVFPAYAMLFAAGGCALESLFQRWRSKWPRGIVLTWIVVVGAATIPLSVPLLSPENFVRYQAALGIKQKPAETSGDAEMPQYFADRFGWENMTAVVASVYNALPDGEKKPQCLIIGSNYGEIGAINYFGSRHGLPSAFGVHNNHFYWEPPTFEPSVVLHIGGSREFLERLFNDVRLGATIHSRYAMSYETNLPVFVCRGPKTPLREVWRAAKKFI